VERGTEVVAIIKTRMALRDAVGTALKVRHPYETPIILYLEPEGGDPGTLAWLFEATAAPAARD
jgi:periplasmic divalent cation tolerance protein